MNSPIAVCGPCTCSDDCVKDHISVQYYDGPPFTTGLRDPCCNTSDFACIPMTCCGPPVIFSYETKKCGISLAQCDGVAIYMSPCNVWNLKKWLIFGKPCYMEYALPYTVPLTCAILPPVQWFSVFRRICSVSSRVGVANPSLFGY